MSVGYYSVTNHLKTQWLKTIVIYFLHSSANWWGLADSCWAQLGGSASRRGSGWSWLLTVGWAQACSCILEAAWSGNSSLEKALLPMMTKALEGKPHHSNTLQASASITSANPPLASPNLSLLIYFPPWQCGINVGDMKDLMMMKWTRGEEKKTRVKSG